MKRGLLCLLALTTGILILNLSALSSCKAQETISLKTAADTAAINILTARANNLSDPDSAIPLYQKALQQSIAGNYADGVIRSLTGLGNNFMSAGNYSQSIICYNQLFAWCKTAKDKAKAYYNLGTCYASEGNLVQGADNFYSALNELEKSNDPDQSLRVHIYTNLGSINIQLSQYSKGMSYLLIGEEIARKEKMDNELAVLLVNKGAYYLQVHQPDIAENCLLEALNIGKAKNDTDQLTWVNLQLGSLFTETGRYDKAISYLESVLTITKNRSNHYDVYFDAVNKIGSALFHLGKYKQAEALIVPELKEAAKLNLKDCSVDGYSTLINIYKATGQYKKALECMDSILVLKDSLTSAQKARDVNQIEIKYKTAEKDKVIAQNQLLIAQQKNVIEQKNSKLAEKNVWILSVCGGIMLVLLVSTLFYRNAVHNQRMQAVQITALQQENKIGILRAAVQGEDNERSRLARELHDGIGGMLSAAMMRIRAIPHENQEIKQIPAYREALGILTEMGDEIRKTAHNLMPEVLLKQNLPEAIQAYCNNLQNEKAPDIDFQYYGLFDNLPENFKLNVYRIVQELLKNVLQHAGATQVLVQLMEDENLLTVTVEDDGKGFDLQAEKNGIGLHNIETRVNTLDGQLTIESKPGKGTTVFIEFDLRQHGLVQNPG
jgi:signal transduction histidine kinase